MTNAQVRKLMEEMQRLGEIGRAAMVAGMDRKTARKYVSTGKLPAELAAQRTWRTREDPFAEDWPRVVELLEGAPELEDRGPLRLVLVLLLQDQPDRPLTHLGRELARSSHDSILSTDGASGEPGAVQVGGRAEMGNGDGFPTTLNLCVDDDDCWSGP